MAVIGRLDRVSIGLVFSIYGVLLWLGFIALSIALPAFYPGIAAITSLIPLYFLLTLFSQTLGSLLSSSELPAALTASAVAVPLAGLVVLPCLGYMFGWIFGLVYNIVVGHAGGGVKIALTEQGKRLSYVGIRSFTRVLIMLAIIFLAAILIVIAFIQTFGDFILALIWAGINIVAIAILMGGVAVFFTIVGIGTALALNLVIGAIGGIDVTLKNVDEGMIEIRGFGSLRFAIAVTLGSMLAATLLLAAAPIYAPIGLNANLVSIPLLVEFPGMIYSFVTVLVFALAYNHLVSKLASVSVSLEIDDINEMGYDARPKSTEYEIASQLNREVQDSRRQTAAKKGPSEPPKELDSG